MGEKIRFVLVDYENVQPQNLDQLGEKDFKVQVFLGPSQKNIPISLVVAMQKLGSNASYVQLESAGKNALDFHLAYYLGVQSTKTPSASFYLLSKDTGFDPLIAHLNGKKIAIKRIASIAEIAQQPSSKPPVAVPSERPIDAIKRDLLRRQGKRPKTREALTNTIASLFKKQLSESKLTELVEQLLTDKSIELDGKKIVYKF